MMTINKYGGDWIRGTAAGITYRTMDDTPTDAWAIVASLKNKD